MDKDVNYFIDLPTCLIFLSEHHFTNARKDLNLRVLTLREPKCHSSVIWVSLLPFSKARSVATRLLLLPLSSSMYP